MSESSITLSSGRRCSVIHVDSFLLRYYYVLACSDAAELGQPESAEFLALAVSEAKRLAHERLADSGRYTLIFNGPTSRRRSGSHVHILLSVSRAQKAWLYSVLAAKNLLQAIGLRRDRA